MEESNNKPARQSAQCSKPTICIAALGFSEETIEDVRVNQRMARWIADVHAELSGQGIRVYVWMQDVLSMALEREQATDPMFAAPTHEEIDVQETDSRPYDFLAAARQWMEKRKACSIIILTPQSLLGDGVACARGSPYARTWRTQLS